MEFKKLALVTAIAAAPLSAFAMDSLSEEALSDVSGQDGISLNLTLPTTGIAMDIYVHDNDGLSGVTGASTFSFDGAIVMESMSIGAGTAKTISIGIDAGDSSSGGTAPILNINVGLPAALTIVTGALRVANSQRDAATPDWSITSASSTIMNPMTIVLGNTTLNIQLGNEAQTGYTGTSDMAVLSASVTSGILISGFRVSDASSGAGIGASTINIINASDPTILNLDVDVNVTNNGVELTLGRVGHAANGADIRITDQWLGTSTNSHIGDITIKGLKLGGSVLTINGLHGQN